MSDTETSAALLSECGLYRYKLWRRWDAGEPACAFVMLNPSTADATVDDPTIRRCIRFAKDWGFGGLVVANLFAYRATNPRELKGVHDPRGANNGPALAAAGLCQRVIAAWGAGCRFRGSRGLQDRYALKDLRSRRPEGLEPILCLGRTKAGFPRHPLYVRADTIPVEYGEAP